MHHHYNDIRTKINEPPKWWDENGVPRYCPFEPYQTANVYANQVLLLHIMCQNCLRSFYVAMSTDSLDTITLRDYINNRSLHYGDPPNAGCCPAGPTMNSIPLDVKEFWEQIEGSTEFVRVPKLETTITEEEE